MGFGPEQSKNYRAKVEREKNERMDRAAVMRKEGLSFRAIARKLYISEATVNRYIKDMVKDGRLEEKWLKKVSH